MRLESTLSASLLQPKQPGRAADPANMTTFVCATCGKPFTGWTCRPRKYCSTTCSDAAKIGRPLPPGVVTGRAANPKNMTAFICEICGVSFTKRADRPRRFCSDACRIIGRRGVPTVIPITVGKVKADCPQCGETFEFYASWPRRFCSMKCYGASRFEGYAPYYGPRWDDACEAVRQRDGVCQRCGKAPKNNERALDVHHLTPFRLFGLERCDEANQLSNLVALCRSCHGIVEWSETRRKQG